MTVSVQQGLSRLKSELERRSKTILKGASLSKIRFALPKNQHFDGEYFEVQVWWRKPGTWPRWGEDAFDTHIERYEFADYFRETPAGPLLKKRPCQIARELTQKILSLRGI